MQEYNMCEGKQRRLHRETKCLCIALWVVFVGAASVCTQPNLVMQRGNHEGTGPKCCMNTAEQYSVDHGPICKSKHCQLIIGQQDDKISNKQFQLLALEDYFVWPQIETTSLPTLKRVY